MKTSRNHKQALVLKMLSTGAAFTVQDLAPVLKMTETGTSALLRDLRKPKYGTHDILGFYPTGSKLYHYRMAGANGRV